MPANARFIHFSTDYVFDGVKTTPHTEEADEGPLSHYAAGRSWQASRQRRAISRHMAVRRCSAPVSQVSWTRSSSGRWRTSVWKHCQQNVVHDVHRGCFALAASVSRRRFARRVYHVQCRRCVARIWPICARSPRARDPAAPGARGAPISPPGVRCAASTPHQMRAPPPRYRWAAAMAGSGGGISGEEVDPPTLKLRRTGPPAKASADKVEVN
jgi:hypothetical protein